MREGGGGGGRKENAFHYFFPLVRYREAKMPSSIIMNRIQRDVICMHGKKKKKKPVRCQTHRPLRLSVSSLSPFLYSRSLVFTFAPLGRIRVVVPSNCRRSPKSIEKKKSTRSGIIKSPPKFLINFVIRKKKKNIVTHQCDEKVFVGSLFPLILLLKIPFITTRIPWRSRCRKDLHRE